MTIGPIYDTSQIMEDPHVIARELIADYPDADMGQIPMHHVVPRLAGTPGSIRTPAPALGQHNRELAGRDRCFGCRMRYAVRCRGAVRRAGAGEVSIILGGGKT